MLACVLTTLPPLSIVRNPNYNGDFLLYWLIDLVSAHFNFIDLVVLDLLFQFEYFPAKPAVFVLNWFLRLSLSNLRSPAEF